MTHFKNILLAASFVMSGCADHPTGDYAPRNYKPADSIRNVGLKLNCGEPYGGIWIEERNPQLSLAEIDSLLSQISWIDDIFYYRDYDGNKVQTSIRREIKGTLSYPVEMFGRGNIRTPIGSEVAVGEALKDIGFASKYEGMKEGCGGSQVSYFVVPKSTGDLKRAEVFEAYLANKMSQFSSQSPDESIQVESSAVVIPKIPPHFGIKPFFVKAPSSAISSNLSQYTWLKFDLIFNMHSETDRYYIVAVFSENAEQAPKAIRTTPPSDNHFRPFGREERYVVEDDIAAHVARFIAGGDDQCYVGDTATNHYSINYTDGPRIADVACTKDVTRDFY
jgi:hypothetical protein